MIRKSIPITTYKLDTQLISYNMEEKQCQKAITANGQCSYPCR
jgi:hypothetical protein